MRSLCVFTAGLIHYKTLSKNKIMPNNIEKIIASLRKVRLTTEDDDRMRARVQEYAESSTTNASDHGSVATRSPYVWLRLVPVVAVLVLVIVGGSTDQNFSDGLFLSNQTSKTSNVSIPAVPQHSGRSIAEDMSKSVSTSIARRSPWGDITDTREFLKVNYSSQIKTRDVPQTVLDVVLTIENAEGRIDNMQSARTSGYVNFVIPKRNLFEFRSRIEDIAHAKLYTESTSSSNLLGSKQDIEGRTEEGESRLGTLIAQKATLDRAHSARVYSLNSRLRSLGSQIRAINDLQSNTPPEDFVTLGRLAEQLQILTSELVSLQADLSNENKKYDRESSTLETEISRANENLGNLAVEDQSFTNDIETVSGYISIRWVNLWELGEAFSPTPMWVNTAVVVLMLWWLAERKKYLLYSIWVGK
jgi:hypothetical protein